jgi:hypothetical protein
MKVPRIGWKAVAAAVVALVAAASLALNLVLTARVADAQDRLEAQEALLGEQAARITAVESSTGVLVAQALGLQQQLSGLAPTVDQALAEAIAGISSFETSTIRFTIDVEEQLPFQATVPFRRTLEFPISTTIPIREQIDTTIRIQAPFGVDIPLDVEVPVNVDVPIDLVIPFTIDETVDIETVVTVDLEFPVEVAVAGTGLADLASQLRRGLETIRETIAGIGFG